MYILPTTDQFGIPKAKSRSQRKAKYDDSDNSVIQCNAWTLDLKADVSHCDKCKMKLIVNSNQSVKII